MKHKDSLLQNEIDNGNTEYMACINLGNFYKEENNVEKSLYYYGLAYNYDSNRIDGVVKIMNYYYDKHLHSIVNALWNKFKNYEILDSVDSSVYDMFEWFNIVSGYYSNDHDGAYESCKRSIIRNVNIPNVLHNIGLYKTQILNDNDNMVKHFLISNDRQKFSFCLCTKINIYSHSMYHHPCYYYFLSSIKYELEKNSYLVNIISSLDEIKDNSYFILYLQNTSDEVYNYDFKRRNIKVIVVIADNIKMYRRGRFNYNFFDKPYVYVWDFSPLNICDYSKNIKYEYFPLFYSEFLEKYHNVNKIPYKEKQIDVLIMCNIITERRTKIIDSLSNMKNINFRFLTGNLNITEIMSIVENSKVIINVYHTEYNNSFDYYRLGILFANKALAITETPYVDVNIQKELENYKNEIICADYDKIIDTALEYLKKDEKEIEEITNRCYDFYKRTKMYDVINSFFVKFHLIS